MLISYTQDSSQETWKGYVYGFSMFLVSVFMSVIIHQYWQIVFVLGMRIRTALIGMIYAKVSYSIVRKLVRKIKLENDNDNDNDL